MAIDRSASAQWSGGLKTGRGTLTTQSGVLSAAPYGFSSRFESQPGTNPEELLGAAHAGCYTMQLSALLEKAGLTAQRLDTTAVVSLEKDATGFSIPRIKLTLIGHVPGTSNEAFQKIAAEAKAICPVSRLLKAEISLDARLA
ncbi:MAG TPA: OsmC family protein [Planctomycetota bacterium]|nr:OsmC family protein [Planctomycetota bacterium]